MEIVNFKKQYEENGLKIQMKGEIVSKPYILMTLKILRALKNEKCKYCKQCDMDKFKRNT